MHNFVPRVGAAPSTLLEPAALAIVMFVALCAAFGAAVAHLVNRSASVGRARPWWLVTSPLLLLVFPPFLVVAVAAVVTNGARAAARPGRRWWRVLRVGAVTLMSAMLLFSALKLGRDTAVLT